MELSKVRTAEEIIARFKDGQIIAIGGQTNQYMPDRLIDCVLESGARHLTIYSIDSSDPGHGVSLLVEAGRVDAMITTHVGTNPLTNAKIQSGALKAEFNPMGTFIERIRCGGAGLGGVLTKTGLGTVVEEGEFVVRVEKAVGGGRYDRIVKMIEDSEKLKSSLETKASGLADALVPWSSAAWTRSPSAWIPRTPTRSSRRSSASPRPSAVSTWRTSPPPAASRSRRG